MVMMCVNARKRERAALQQRQHLRCQDDPMSIPAIDQHARDGRQQKRRNLRRESHDTQNDGGLHQRIPLSKAIHQPRGCRRVIQDPVSEIPWPRKKRR
jgi:hypothetical protein